MTFPVTTLDVQELTDNVASVAQASGLFYKVNTYEPSQPVDTGLACSVFLSAAQPVAAVSGLASTSVRYEFTCRIYTPMIFEAENDFNPNVDTVDAVLGNAVVTLIQAYTNDFELDDSVMEIDLLGAYGVSLGGQAGYLYQGQRYMRIFDITVPLIITDVWDQTP